MLHSKPVCHRSIVAMVLLLNCAVVSGAEADRDPTANLAKVRERYEQTMELLRADILKAIDAKIDAANKPGQIDLDKVKEAGDEKDAFNNDGALPKVASLSLLQSRCLQASKAMSDAYGMTLAAATKSGNTVLRDALRGEMDLFSGRLDLVPWRDRLNKSTKSADQRTINSPAAPLVVDTDLDSDYRLEIIATPTSDKAALTAEFPIAAGKHLVLPATLNDKRQIRMLMTVTSDVVSTDLGITRPVDISKADSADQKAITLRCTDGSAVIESVRIKPLVNGKVVEAMAAPAKVESPRSGTASAQIQLPPVGSTWTGGFVGGPAQKLRRASRAVTSQSHDGLLVIDITTDRGRYFWRFTVNGTAVRLDEVNPFAGNGADISHINMIGTLKNGRLSVKGEWRVEAPGNVAGQASRVALDLQQN